jgi:dGTPase
MNGFSSKISHVRFYSPKKAQGPAVFPIDSTAAERKAHCDYIGYQCESDRGRIINSAAVRRLQQKTQVFPLERNAAVRSRLTHSLEVMQVGRYIARSLIKKLRDDPYHKQDIDGLEQALESIVEMSCLMHDVGNPPFGHFGERAIQDWLNAHLESCIEQSFATNSESILSAFKQSYLLQDLIHFEGNAQGIRIITQLQKLNLTKTQIASVLKYTRCGTEPKPDKDHPQYYLLKKVGYYFSERSLVNDITQFHNLELGHRHPIAYIMEAADDISYCIADLEDAIEKNLMTLEQLKTLLEQQYCKLADNCDAMSRMLEKIKDWKNYSDSDVSQFFIAMRSLFVGKMVKHAASMIFDNLASIMEGSFAGHILEDDSRESRMAQSMKQVAFNHVFNHPEVEANELKGYTVITGLLEKYKPLLQAPKFTFSAALNNNQNVPVLLSRLCKKLPKKHLKAYEEALEAESGNDFLNSEVKEYYYRCRLIQDYISGMTDQYALDEYRKLMALEVI